MTMKSRYSLELIVLLSALSLHLAIVPASAEDQASSTNSLSGRIKFRPPATGAPSVRVTGGSRGTGDTTVMLDVLAPDAVGTTTQEQPTLFWYQSKASQAKMELTLLQENKSKPLLQIKGDQPAQAGIHRVRLADHGVKLARGVEYQWVVALVNDPNNRSSDVVSSGVIKRIDPTSALRAKTQRNSGTALADAYAEAGVWYDALAALSETIDAHPNDTALRQARAELLQQVGLKGPAQAEVAAGKL
jgi:hypothetical protein